MTRCAECGFVYADLGVERVAPTLQSFGDRYRRELSEPAVRPLLATRPDPGVWSALEYACHVRDVLLVQRDRALLALVEDRPSFPRMHRDERVFLARYAEEPPADVAAQLVMAAELIARVFRGLSDEQLARPLVYNWPEPADHDVAWLGRHTVHEGEHHLGDVRSVLDRCRAEDG